MRTLAAALTTSQKASTLTPRVKVVLTSGANSYTYEQDRIRSINHSEEQFRQSADIVLNNSDATFTTLNLMGYKAVISYGLVTASGDLYSARAPLWVIGQQLHSQPGALLCTLSCAGIPNLLAEDHASDNFNPDTTNTDTVKTIIRKIAGDTGVTMLSVFNHCTAYNVTFTGTDSLIDVFTPKDSYSIPIGSTRLEVIRHLLQYTESVFLARDDGKIHIIVPTTIGTTYDYTYDMAAGEHTFFQKTLRNRLVMPNYIVVKSNPSHGDGYTNFAEDTDSSAKIAVRSYHYARLASNAQAGSIASGMLEKLKLDAERGAGVAPLNVGAEVHDYVKITDPRENDNRVGNKGYITTRFQGGGSPKFEFSFGFGSLMVGGLVGTTAPSAIVSSNQQIVRETQVIREVQVAPSQPAITIAGRSLESYLRGIWDNFSIIQAEFLNIRENISILNTNTWGLWDTLLTLYFTVEALKAEIQRLRHEGALQGGTTLGGTPAVVLGTAVAAGTATTFVRIDDTIKGFDVTVPVTQAANDAASTGVAVVAARRDHRHGMPSMIVPVYSQAVPTIALAFTDDTVAVFSQSLPAITYEFT